VTTKPRKSAPRSTGATRTTPARLASPSIPAPPAVKPATMVSAFTKSINIVPRTAATLHLMPGRLEDGSKEEQTKVLVPFAEVRLGGGVIADLPAELTDEDEMPTLFSANMPLENLAFVLLDLTSDLKRLCTEAAAISGGELSVDPARMAHVRYFVAHLERQARQCRLRLDQAYGEPTTKE
jgi:hypothetical protein